MAEGHADTPGTGASAGPGGGQSPAAGTTAAGGGPAPQVAVGSEPQAPAEPGTTDAGPPDIGGQPQPTGGGQAGQAQPGKQPADPRALQQRYDDVAHQRNLYQQAHPDEFDAQGNFVGPQAAPDVGGEQQRQWGGAQPGQQAQPQVPQGQLDPRQVMQQAWNEQVAGLLYGDNPIGAVQAALQVLAQTGSLPHGLMPQSGQPGAPTPEQVQALAAQTYQQHAQAERQFHRQVESLEAEFGADFLSQQVPVSGIPMALEDALPVLCERTGISNPLLALQQEPYFARQIHAMREQAMRERITAELLAQGAGGQIPPGGGAFSLAAVEAEGSTIESIGGGTEPLKR